MISAIFVAVLVLVTSWFYSKWRHSYWASRGVPTAPQALPFIGHFYKMLTTPRWEFEQELYTKHGGSRYLGIYEVMTPVLMVGDPELLKYILVKDFDHFVDRRPFGSKKQKEDSFRGKILSALTGNEWREIRLIMSPTFTAGKLKNMFHLVYEKADALVEFSLKEAKEKEAVDMKQIFGRFTIDTIASCAFGIECNSFVDQDAKFAKEADAFFGMTSYKFFKFMLSYIAPRLSNALRLGIDTEEIYFFRDIVEEAIAVRLKGKRRGDFLDLLLEARKNNSVNHGQEALTDAIIISQSVMFLIAGYDTTASTLAFATFLLAKNQEPQTRLRKELQAITKEYGDITYQGIMEAKYLDACVQETLRMFTPAFIDRTCTKDYTLPGTDVRIYKGQIVNIPSYSIHHDPQYWPEPQVYRPERFLPENRDKIKSFTHLPFGMGPRNCVATRFALMEIKVAMAKIVLAAEFQLAPRCLEIKLEKKTFVLRPQDGSVELLFTPLKEE